MIKDLSCSLCESPRKRVKLIIGKGGKLCEKCFYKFSPVPSSGPCIICNRGFDFKSILGPPPNVCELCWNGCTQVFRFITPGQTWIIFKESPYKCKPHQSTEANKIFYKKSLQQLSENSINIDSGEMLVDMFEIKPTKRLLIYARKFIHEFPNHPQGPRIVSFWLKHFPTEEAHKLSAKLLKSHFPVGELHWLFNSVVRGAKNQELDQLMEKRLEKNPKDDIWCRSLSPYEGRADFANKLALRWLDLNQDNPKLLLQGFSFFATEPEVVDRVFKHLKRHPILRYNEWEIPCVLDKAHELKMSILPEVIEFAHQWLSNNPHDEENAPHILASLIAVTELDSDIEAAKKWYLKHRRSESRYRILIALLERTVDGVFALDPFGIEESFKLLREMRPVERIPALIGALLRAQQDDEVIGWAKEAYSQTGLLWILVELLKRVPDNKLIAEGKSQLRKHFKCELGHELLLLLLDLDPDSTVEQCAHKWLAKNPGHRHEEKVRSQLRNKLKIGIENLERNTLSP